MKKFSYISLIVSILIISIISLNGFATNAKSKIKGHEITDYTGAKATVYTSADSNQSNKKVKSSVNVSFIEDSNNSDLIALINIKGFIPSELNKKGDANSASMRWASGYTVGVEISDTNEEVSILDTIPTNKIETTKVKETMGYNIGGSIGISKGTPTTGGKTGFNFSKTISYDQPDFKTTQIENGYRRASWNIDFTSTKDGYTKDSWNVLYGNQLFMKSRYHNSGIKNLTDNKDLSTLISGGFSPDVVIAVKAPKDIDTNTTLKVNYGNKMLDYNLEWSSTEWSGSIHNPGPAFSTNDTHVYSIDWKNHTVKKVTP